MLVSLGEVEEHLPLLSGCRIVCPIALSLQVTCAFCGAFYLTIFYRAFYVTILYTLKGTYKEGTNDGLGYPVTV